MVDKLVLVIVMYNLFFRQRTAYEMSISDWISDVCSSDLPSGPQRSEGRRSRCAGAPTGAGLRQQPGWSTAREDRSRQSPRSGDRARARELDAGDRRCAVRVDAPWHRPPRVPRPARSEEHTSELQSLMRISYAVFCLKKKTQQTTERYNRLNKPYQYERTSH